MGPVLAILIGAVLKSSGSRVSTISRIVDTHNPQCRGRSNDPSWDNHALWSRVRQTAETVM